jgi:DHA1 family multidrug resistance protein-like MFS transporter
MKKHLFVLLACLFVVMIGFGITLPVLPFYVAGVSGLRR